MYKYALCTIIMYAVSLDDFYSVKKLTLHEIWVQSRHGLCIAGAEIYLHLFTCVRRNWCGHSMTAKSDCSDPHGDLRDIR